MRESFPEVHESLYPEHSTVTLMVERGFDCEYQIWDYVVTNSTGKKPTAWYFRSVRDHEAGHFWVRFEFLDPYEIIDDSDPLQHLRRTWRVEIGDIEAPVTFQRFGDKVGKSVEATFGFHAWQSAFLGSGMKSELQLVARPSGDDMWISDCPGLREFKPLLRHWVARGLVWLGAPIEQVMEVAGVELSAHERSEWQLDRRDDTGTLQILNIKASQRRVRPKGARSEIEDGRALIKLREAMGDATFAEVAHTVGKSPAEIRRLIHAAQSTDTKRSNSS